MSDDQPPGRPGRRGPLAGLVVLDLSRVLTGPYCSMMLADLGADVIKVEEPGKGDDTRGWGPPFVDGESAYFLAVNRNKRSLTVNLKDPRGVAIVRRLARTADVCLENFRPGTAERLGIGYPDLAEENPRLVYCAISGFGQTGPYRDRPGYDVILQGMGGLMGITGMPDGPPMRVGVAVADIGAGMFAAYAILAALYHRERTGEGQYIDVSMLDTQVAWMTYAAGNYFATGEPPRRMGVAHPNIVPYQAFCAGDGEWFNVAVGNDALWRKFVAALDIADWAGGPEYATNRGRVERRGALVARLEALFATAPAAHWLDRLGAAGIPCGPIYRMDQVFSDPQVRHREMEVTLDHPTAGRIRVTGVPVKLERTPGAVHSPPPVLGQHTDAILAALGYSAAEIAALRADGVV